MWRNLCRCSSLKKLKPCLNNSNSSLPSVKFVQDSIFTENLALTHVNSWLHELGFRRIDRLLSQNDKLGDFSFLNSSNGFGFRRDFRGFATAAEAIESTEEESSTDEVHELLEEMKKEFNVREEWKKPKLVNGISQGKMFALRRRQVKIETEAWENAAKEYQELLEDMCAQKLAPNLPFIKSLFLGWFEPLRNAIAAEQDLCKEGKNRGAYSSHFDLLPADKMAVITMHKLMGLLMTGGGQGTARVIAAACQIGEAIEHEARIHRFLEKSKRKSTEKKSPEAPKDGPDPEKDQDKLRRKVNILLKQQKVHRVRAIVKQQDEAKPWGQDTQVKVGCRLIQLLIETAYIQPAVDQIDDGPPDIRPAFMHTLKNVETPRGSRRYGVIECDPLVHKGLEKSNGSRVIITSTRIGSRYFSSTVPAVEVSEFDGDALHDTVKATEKVSALHLALSQLAVAGDFCDESRLSFQRFFGTRRRPAISTGSLKLDIALGIGGLPKGRIVEIYGREASGKTTLALHVIKEAQKLGGYCAYLDVENALDPMLAETIGVNTKNLLISQPDCAENLLSMVDTLTKSGSVAVVVVDSVAALVPQQDIDLVIGDKKVDLQSEIMTKALRKINYSLSRSETIIIFVNQVRFRPGKDQGFAQAKEVTCGGNALPFYSAIRLRMIRKRVLKTNDKITGLEVCVEVVKNKLAPAMKTAELGIHFGRGFCSASEVLELGCEQGCILKEGDNYFIDGEVLHSKEDAKTYLDQNDSVCDKVVKTIRSQLFPETRVKQNH